MVVLVTGANGQLGCSLKHIESQYPDLQLVFFDSKTLDITDKDSIQKAFEDIKPHFCINTAAYTAVDNAESEPEKAFSVNSEGVRFLAEACHDTGAILLHISTDFVFDGTKNTPYTEQDATNPQSVYGRSKLAGEQAIENTFRNYFIIRTSWLYSNFGANFMKTMIRLGNERDSLSVVNDQIGTPTNAVDLAKALLTMIRRRHEQPENSNFGLYHFSNEGQCSWFEFAQKIFEVHKIEIDLHPIPTTAYPTPAERPSYSVLDKTKIKESFGISINDWEESLAGAKQQQP